MGKRFLRSVVSDFQTLAASADIVPIDLPVNPLSHLLLTLTLNLTPAQAADKTFRTVKPFMDAIGDASIRYRGENILQGNGQDLAMLSALITGYAPWGREFHGVNNTVRAMTFLLPFARRPFDHLEAFPATTRGQLRFFMTAAAAPAGYTTMQWALESVELIEDEPQTYIKSTTLSRALTASGRQQIDLPIGNLLLGALLFDPSDEIDATVSYAFGKVKVLKDNVEQYFPESNWESLAETLGRRFPAIQTAFGHFHEQLAADTSTGEPVHLVADKPPLQYGYLDFDPLNDGSYAMETAGASSLKLDMNSDVATGTVRVMPVELVTIKK